MESLLDLLDDPFATELDDDAALSAAIWMVVDIGRRAELEAWRLEHHETAPTSAVGDLWEGGIDAPERVRPSPAAYEALLEEVTGDAIFAHDAGACWAHAIRGAARELADEYDWATAETFLRERLGGEMGSQDVEWWVEHTLADRPDMQ